MALQSDAGEPLPLPTDAITLLSQTLAAGWIRRLRRGSQVGMTFPRCSAPNRIDKGNDGGARLHDIEWHSSLSEPELGFLISLKELAIRCAMQDTRI